MLKFLKKDKEVVEGEVEESEEVEEENAEKDEEVERDSDDLSKLMERLNDVENKLPRLDVAVDGLKKEIDDLKGRIKGLEDTLKDVMVLYEVVSNQINPFTSGDSIDFEVFKKRLKMIEKDLLLLLGIDLDRIIDDTLYGG